MTEGRWELPRNWVWITLGRLSKVVGGGTPKKSKLEINYAEDGAPWVTPADLSGYKQTYISRGRRSLSETGVRSSSAKVMPKGTVLLSSRAPIGYCAVAANDISTNQGFKSILPTSAHNPEFMRYYFLNSKRYLEDNASGTTFSELSGSAVKQLLLPLPPLAEQSRIVDKIDELFSSIEAGERAIARARTALTRYRKAVLKAAVTGELTADWREQNPPTETAEALLKRILKARYAAWEKTELEKLDAKGKARPKTEKEWGKFRARYKAPVEADTEGLSDLPEGWVWASQDMLLSDLITGPFGSMLHQSDYVETGVPLVNPISIVQGKIIESKLKFLDNQTINRLERFQLAEGDVVISRRGDMGRCASVLQKHDGWLCGTGSMILRPNKLTLTEYLSQSLQYGHALAYLNANAIGTTMKNLNRTILKLVPIAICSIAEQEEILSRIEEALSKADKVEATLNTQARSARALKQAVLKTAFEGRLVPQDPNDEPASELLKRIKAGS